MNLRPSGYEPDELPGCSTPRHSEDGSRTTGDRRLFSIVCLLRRGRRRTVTAVVVVCCPTSVLGRPGGDLLSHVLRQSTIGAEAFDGRVRDGIGSCRFARATRPAKNGCRTSRRTDDRGQRTEGGYPSPFLSSEVCRPFVRQKQNWFFEGQRAREEGRSVLRSLSSVLCIAPWRREQSSRTSD